ncbi:GNAT family N-acetyltransferase [Solidesulfovibrio sp.]|mgnify:CR=1 FL=1|uniref:GNAT family N-acetyltransferase n=1 Tax=Solidesulfovibrio sp. TaxID=2910990 RepID=UPI000EC51D0B|nr:GNAT family N-acetyltransferase [Solidesulfovibrio sp.]MEA5089768.1 GNAT family N-acetyltransferase [Solidesulfovibrio sp.]HCR12278.1 GNAT family N-acetyltransferase [Desulfovibrio sp.]HML62832.1 GNAT family N-acetyltransferase [Solidesulfovibrio sp.]
MNGATRKCQGNMAAQGVALRPGYEPGIVGRVGELHGRYYAKAWGAGAPFEILATRDMCAFIEGYDPARDLMLGAYAGERLVGSVAVLGRSPDPDGAQLRFFIVDPDWHGRGVGKALLARALDWCRARGTARVFLWTVDGLAASRRLYEKAGFRIVAREPDDRYTVLRDNLKMVLDIAAERPGNHAF